MLPTVGVAASRAKKTKGCVTWHTKGPLRYISHSWWCTTCGARAHIQHATHQLACSTPTGYRDHLLSLSLSLTLSLWRGRRAHEIASPPQPAPQDQPLRAAQPHGTHGHTPAR